MIQSPCAIMLAHLKTVMLIREAIKLERCKARDPARRKPGARERAPGGWVCHRVWPGTARKSNVVHLPPPSCGPTICRRNRWGWVRCHMGGSGGDRPRRPRPWQQRLTLGTWNVTSLWREGAGASAGGWAFPVRSGGASLLAQHWLMIQTPG